LPGLVPILDNFYWPELTPDAPAWAKDDIDPIFYVWILFATKTGYYFYFGETEEIFIVGKSLEGFLAGLDTMNQYEGGWDTFIEDNSDK
jgi:hypothetical protein